MKIRAFFALTLPDSVVRWLADHADTLCEYDRKTEVDWVDSDRYHLTLCFLGDVSLEQVEALERCTREKLADFTSFQVHINAAEYYRVNKGLALIAALPAVHKELEALHDLMINVADAAGVNHTEEDFKPHITLGRLPGKISLRSRTIGPQLICLVLQIQLYCSRARPEKMVQYILLSLKSHYRIYPS